MTDNKKTQKKIEAAFKLAQFSNALSIKVTNDELDIVFPADFTGASGAVTDVLREADINYVDPRPDKAKDCVIVALENGKDGFGVQTRFKYKRMDRGAYDALLDTAVDSDGDGKKDFNGVADTQGTEEE